jgi:hypothetical protein
MVGQFYLERYYAKGSSRKMTAKENRALVAILAKRRDEGRP